MRSWGTLLLTAFVLTSLAGQQTSLPMEEAHRKLHQPDKPALEQATEQTVRLAPKLAQPGRAPASPRAGNLVDRHIFGRMAHDGITPAPLASDWEFARRSSLDLTGRIPEPAMLLEFIADKSPDRRDRWIDGLMSSTAWVDRWAYWFGDLYRNCQNRIGWDGRDHFDAWIRESLRSGKSYDRFVTEMLTDVAPETNWNAKHPASTYLARWHVLGATTTSDMYEDTSDEIMVNIGRHFLGLNFQCVSCHDGRGHLEKLNLYLTGVKREQFWAMSAFFSPLKVEKIEFQDQFRLTNTGGPYSARAESAVRIQRTGASTGDTVGPVFLLTGERPAPDRDPRAEFARMLAAHPQFARTTVNYFWKEFFGVGLVEPLDDWDPVRLDPSKPVPEGWQPQAFHYPLLEALAQDFAANGFDLRRLMRLLAQSHAYQLSSTYPGEWKESSAPYFARKFVRRLSAEEIHDAVVSVTDVPGNYKLHGSARHVRYVTEMPSPEEINDKKANFLLHSFGASNREQFDKQVVGSIVQAMLLFGGEFVNDRVRAGGRTRLAALLAAEPDDAKLVEQLYLWAISRYPTEAERLTCLAQLRPDRAAGAEDVQLALLNKVDFIFNY